MPQICASLHQRPASHRVGHHSLLAPECRDQRCPGENVSSQRPMLSLETPGYDYAGLMYGTADAPTPGSSYRWWR